jgi:tetratricopeptide (TPR) repeat protein
MDILSFAVHGVKLGATVYKHQKQQEQRKIQQEHERERDEKLQKVQNELRNLKVESQKKDHTVGARQNQVLDQKQQLWDEFQKTMFLAQNAVPAAQFKIAQYFARGQVVDKDEKEALTWYKKAALNGHVESMFQVGIAYEKGLGDTINSETAEEFYLQATAGKHEKAMFRLGLLYNIKKFYDKSLQYFTQVAQEFGNLDACYFVATAYFKGRGTNKNLEKAVEWMRLASEKGHTSASKEIDVIEKQFTEEKIALATSKGKAFMHLEYRLFQDAQMDFLKSLWNDKIAFVELTTLSTKGNVLADIYLSILRKTPSVMDSKVEWLNTEFRKGNPFATYLLSYYYKTNDPLKSFEYLIWPLTEAI